MRKFNSILCWYSNTFNFSQWTVNIQLHISIVFVISEFNSVKKHANDIIDVPMVL